MIEKEKSRIDAFSDGIFAIAITLLILEIKVPALSSITSSQELWKALLAEWPSFLAFGISFAAILIMWVNHHGLFNILQRIDSRFLFANGFLLFMIIFIPFPTAVLAEFLNTAASSAAAVLYCGTYILICSSFNYLLYTATTRKHLIKLQVSDQHIRKLRLAYGTALPTYIVATILAFFYPIAGLILCSSLWLLWASLDYRIE
jgi:uncharacterized membrane protein